MHIRPEAFDPKWHEHVEEGTEPGTTTTDDQNPVVLATAEELGQLTRAALDEHPEVLALPEDVLATCRTKQNVIDAVLGAREDSAE